MKYQLYHNGIITFEDVLAHKEKAKLNKKQQLQVETEVYDKPPTVNKQELQKFLDGLTYPLYHLDFETYMQGVPLYDGIWTYRQIPFQYSLHIQKEKGSECEHREHLGKEGTDTRRALAEQLCADIPMNVCSLAYSASFERRIIRELANDYPDLAEHLMNIHDNIKDLAAPFKNFDYYCKEFYGRYTIKLVLPAMCPNDPKLDYHNLDQIQNGGDASTTFAKLHTKSPEEIESTRKNLLAYCELDTYAMVKILEKLYEECD